MSTRHARHPAGSSRTTYIRSAQSRRIGNHFNANEHRLPPSGVSRMLLWLLTAMVLFVVANYTFKLFG